MVKIPIESAILRGTATKSTKATYAWDSGSLIVLDTVEVMTPTQAGIQCPGSLLKKFQNLRLRSRDINAYNGTVINSVLQVIQLGLPVMAGDAL